MKILIVGTGIIGTLYVYSLSECHEVTHFVRENKFSIMNNRIIKYDINRYINDKKLVEACFKAMSECYSLCEKRGVNLGDFSEVEM